MGIDFAKSAAPKSYEADPDIGKEMEEVYAHDEVMPIDDAYHYIQEHHFDDERGNDIEQWREMADLVDAFRTVRDVPENQRDGIYETHRNKACETLISAADYADEEMEIPGDTFEEQARSLESISSDSLDMVERAILSRGYDLARVQGVEFLPEKDFEDMLKVGIMTECSIEDMPAHRAEQKGSWSKDDAAYLKRRVESDMSILRDLEDDADYEYAVNVSNDPEVYHDEAKHAYEHAKREFYEGIARAELTDWPERGDVSIIDPELKASLGNEYVIYLSAEKARQDIKMGHTSGSAIVGPSNGDRRKAEASIAAQAKELDKMYGNEPNNDRSIR